jgi:UDP-N-acetylglucosamine 2-epimerase (non-hydrolysing)
MKILIVVGTRPNFIKITQFKKLAVNFSNLEIKIVHTGQHFDRNMADVFFEQLEIYPDYFLNVKPGNIIKQLTDTMLGLQDILENTYKADLIMAVGDVNSTLAASLTGNKLGIKVAHLEAGLRSFDRRMPEEVNRVITDVLADYYFITEQNGIDNLSNSEMRGEKYFVGNTMIDTLISFQDKIEMSTILDTLNLSPKNYILLTLHRPSNVDNKTDLEKVVEITEILSKNKKVIFPIHPRTRKKLIDMSLYEAIDKNKNLIEMEPLDYFSFQKLIKESLCVVTDSGGIQEETTYYGIPCLTFRENTERPSTVEIGTNELLSFDPIIIENRINNIIDGKFKQGRVPDKWDGNATQRILEVLSTLE